MMIKEIQLIWMPDEAQLQEVQEVAQSKSPEKCSYMKRGAISSFRQFIKNCLGVNIIFKDIHLMTNISYQSVDDSDDEDMSLEKKKNTSQLSSCMAFLFIVSCDLHLESESQFHRKNLIHLFCSRKMNKEVPQVWLTMDDFFVPEKVQLENFIAYSEIDVHSFGLGSLVELNTFVQHFDSTSSLLKSSKFKITQVKVKLSSEYIELYFVVGNTEVPIAKRSALTHRLFRLCFKYSSFCKLLICHASKDDFTVYLHYRDCPLLYVASNASQNGDPSDQKYISYDSIDHSVGWLRIVDLFDNCPSEISQEFIRNSTLRMKFKSPEYTSIRHLLEQFCSHITAYFTSMQIISASTNARISSITSAHHDCFYALKCILTRNNEFIDQIIARNQLKELNSFFSEKVKENSKILSDTLIHIYNQIDQGYVVMFLHSVKALYAQLIKGDSASGQQKKKKAPDECEVVYIKKAILMPRHIRFIPPEPQLKNRILRKCGPDNLLRVAIRDVNMSRLDFTLKAIGAFTNKKCKVDFLDANIKRQLSNGIKLGNRRYEYFGMSSSQLKSHSLWCYAKGEDKKTVDEIRKDIGDLDAIHDVPKFMARMGLSFSQAIGHLKVPQEFTNVDSPEVDVVGYQKTYMSDSEDDDKKQKHLSGKYIEHSEETDEESGEESIKNKWSDDDDDADDDPYLFSDGIGRISEELADKIYEELKLQEVRPSAFQIRYAGCKGMLVVDPLLKGKLISFRESMKKYNSEDDSLEILKISKPRSMFLNRPFITILEHKGVPKERFICLQKTMIHSLIKSMFYDEDAQHLLSASSKLQLNYEKLLNNGISFTEDPLFRSMILAIFRSQISLLKTKARIALPENEARNMFGVLDETKTLDYGQVFVQYTLWNEKTTRILEGTVVVTKPPCLHPGDVRKFTAVDVEGLRHIKDCIVFPAKGFRPHPDEMAGSDLDGDEYLVIWNEDLIFETENTPAMHYAVKKKKVSKKLNGFHPIQVSDELDHFSNYILNDSVGRIASAHLAQADRLKKGISDDICLALAKKHAKAVDFAKTGHPAIMNSKEVARKYPDFMEKINRNHTYISSKALGHLYRNCKDLEIGLEATTDRMEFTVDSDLLHESWKVYEKSAKRTYQQYCKKISYCLKTYGIESEGEFLSSSFIQRSKLCDNNDMRNLLEIIEYEVSWLVKKYEEEFFEEFGGKPKLPKYSEAMFQKASAWYAVSYTGGSSAGEGSRYFGLPWMVSDILATLKLSKQKQQKQSDNIFVKKANYIEEAIDKYVAKYMDLNKNQLDPEILKLEIIDAARKVLSKWLLSWKDSFMYNSSDNIMKMEKCIDDVFSSLCECFLSCDNNYIRHCMEAKEAKKVTSPGHYVLATLIQISEMGTGHNDMHASFSPCLQELGLSAWVTLIRLACSSNVQYLGLKLSSDDIRLSFYSTQAEVCDIFQLETDSDYKTKKWSDQFWTKFREDEDNIKKYFIHKLGMKDIALHPEFKGKSLVLTLFVKGSRFAIERLKHTVVMEGFLECVVNDKPISYNSEPSPSHEKMKKN